MNEKLLDEIARDLVNANYNDEWEIRARAANALYQLRKAHTWTPISEGTPKADQQVWVCYDNGACGYAIYTKNDDWFIDLNEAGDLYSRKQIAADGLIASKILYWMPLPPLPTLPPLEK